MRWRLSPGRPRGSTPSRSPGRGMCPGRCCTGPRHRPGRVAALAADQADDLMVGNVRRRRQGSDCDQRAGQCRDDGQDHDPPAAATGVRVTSLIPICGRRCTRWVTGRRARGNGPVEPGICLHGGAPCRGSLSLDGVIGLRRRQRSVRSVDRSGPRCWRRPRTRTGRAPGC